jgi:pyruvate formate lyase activating enzyme
MAQREEANGRKRQADAVETCVSEETRDAELDSCSAGSASVGKASAGEVAPKLESAGSTGTEVSDCGDGADDAASSGAEADDEARDASDDPAPFGARCGVCPHACVLALREFGACGVRRNVGGRVVCDNYGKLVTIQPKTLGDLGFSQWREGERLQPDTSMLSIEAYGVPFDPKRPCAFPPDAAHAAWPEFEEFPPIESMPFAQRLAQAGRVEGVVFAGPEPLYSFEYVLECLRLARSFGLASALVTTGYVTERVLRQVLPYLDAVLVRTAADAGAYEACGTDYSAVERTIELLYADGSCTVDVQELA